MRFISTQVHGVLDYGLAVLLIAAPWLLGFAAGGAETWVPVVLGAAIVVYSLLTDYELGATKRIRMPTHLWLDAIGGVILAVSPWVFDFVEWVYWPHLIFGILEVGVALLTDAKPAHEEVPIR